MSVPTSKELNNLIQQLQGGMITECEFVLHLQLAVPDYNDMCRFNQLDPVIQNWDFGLDDFINWDRSN